MTILSIDHSTYNSLLRVILVVLQVIQKEPKLSFLMISDRTTREKEYYLGEIYREIIERKYRKSRNNL